MRGIMKAVAALLALAGAAGAAEPEELTADEVLEMTLDDLLDVDVVSVSRIRQRPSDTAAAVSVLTAEDLRRAGHTNLAEALRLVPGFHAARINANVWSVGARGLTGRFADKLLVLVDGRSVYAPAFSGVVWDAQDTFMPDLDRIEVIRGPGASAWGANAVNGVVNVRTRSAKDTQGGLLEAGGGVEEQALFGFRYGGAFADDAWYRVFVKGKLHDDSHDPAGIGANDGWHQLRAGFRVDWECESDAQVTISGEVYGGESGQRAIVPTLTAPFATQIRNEPESNGGHLLARWSQRGENGVERELQVYLDRAEYSVIDVRNEATTFDIDFQRRLADGEHHLILWGAGYRLTSDRFKNGFAISATPTGRTDHLVSAFIQDVITILPSTLVLTIGTKLEHNDYSGFEVQPSARLLWNASETHTLWFSVSRALRTPSRADHDIRLNLAAFDNAGTTTLLAFLGDRGFEPEELIAYEFGFRWRGGESFSIEVAAFFNSYDGLRGFTGLAPGLEAAPPPPHALAASIFDNVMDGDIYGGELSINWQPHARVRVLGSYSYSRAVLTNRGVTVPLDPEVAEGRYPRNLATIRVQMDVATGWEVDLAAYYTDVLPTAGANAHIGLDLRVGWSPRDNLQVDLIARNITDRRHLESAEELMFLQPAEVESAVLLRVTYRW